MTLIVGCGGGGGGSADPGTPPVDTPSATGLVPVAPARGALLRADATVLRPLVPGATWSYRGIDKARAGIAPVSYISTVSHAAAVGGVSEADTNGGNVGPGSIHLEVAGGTILHMEQIDFAGKGQPESIAIVELKSPVVQNDQYTIIDRSYDDTDIDADGDKHPDALDVAIYARVIGEEVLNLANTPSLKTVRVDLAVRTRVRLSSTGELSPVIQINVRTWYADGIGVVRQVVEEPIDVDGAMHVTDEQLTAWDGLLQGYGAMPKLSARVPADSGELAGTVLPPPGNGFVAAVRSGDQALVFTEQPFGGVAGTFVSRMDSRGRVLGTQLLPHLKINSNGGALVAHSTGVNYVAPSVSNAIVPLTRLDGNGALLGETTIELGGGRFMPTVERIAAAADGPTMWLLWQRRSVEVGVGFQFELVLRAFDASGSALAPEIVLAAEASNFALAAGSGRALVSWTEADARGKYRVRYAGTALSAGAPNVHTLESGLTGSSSFVVPTSAGEAGALLWSSSLGSGATMAHPAGVRLDRSLVPLRSSSGGLDSETLAGVSTFDSTVPGPTTAGDRIVFTTPAREALWPDEASNALDIVSWIDAGSGPLASAATHTVRSLAADGYSAKAQVAWPDRVLLFGGGRQLETKVVWLNGSSAP